jgi:hypothetical protein
MFRVPHLLTPLLFLFVYKDEKQELVVETKGTPLPIKLNVNFKWIRYS